MEREILTTRKHVEKTRKMLWHGGFISSVEVGRRLRHYELDSSVPIEKCMAEMAIVAKYSAEFETVRLNIEGTIKHWYKKTQLKALVDIVNGKRQSSSIWRVIDPPKDRAIIAIVEDYPWPTVVTWNGASKKWAYADTQCGMFEGKLNDFYFETGLSKNILRWMPMPTD